MIRPPRGRLSTATPKLMKVAAEDDCADRNGDAASHADRARLMKRSARATSAVAIIDTVIANAPNHVMSSRKIPRDGQEQAFKH